MVYECDHCGTKWESGITRRDWLKQGDGEMSDKERCVLHVQSCDCHTFSLGVGGPDGCDRGLIDPAHRGYLQRCSRLKNEHPPYTDPRCKTARCKRPVAQEVKE